MSVIFGFIGAVLLFFSIPVIVGFLVFRWVLNFRDRTKSEMKRGNWG